MHSPALGPAARALKTDLMEGTYTPPEPRSVERDEIIGTIRPEMYAIGAVIASDVVAQMKERQIGCNPHFGLVNRGGYAYKKIKTYDDIHDGMMSTAYHFIHDVYDLPELYKPAAKRLTDLVNAAHSVAPNEGNGRYDSPQIFILAGINTAISMSVGAHVGIATLHRATAGEHADRSKFEALAKRSMHRLTSPIAMDNIDHIRAYQRAILINFYDPDDERVKNKEPFAYNPNLLRIVPNIDDPRAYVDFKVPPSELIDAWSCGEIGKIATRHATLTCPGTVTFPGVETSTRTIWDWTTTIVAQTKYKDQA